VELACLETVVFNAEVVVLESGADVLTEITLAVVAFSNASGLRVVVLLRPVDWEVVELSEHD
jgi:hypothetical protein